MDHFFHNMDKKSKIKKQTLFKNYFALCTQKIVTFPDWSREIPVLQWEMEHAQQPIRNDVMFKSML